MTRQYATPAAFKAAVEHRLRTSAQETGSSLERLRQLLVFDRLLVRIFDVLGDAVVLKGGLVVELRVARARTTKDIDIRMTGDPARVLEQLQEAGRLDKQDYLTYEVVDDPRQPEITADGMVYAGRRFRAEARLAGKIYGRRFGVDVGFADAITEQPDLMPGSSFLEFAGIEPAVFRVYPLAAHIAEKLHAYTLPRDRPNTRVKDLPDIALLASQSIDARTLQEAISATFAHRKTHPVPRSLPAPPEAWEAPYAAMAREENLEWPTLDEVYRAVSVFLDHAPQHDEGTWNPEQWAWEKAGDDPP